MNTELLDALTILEREKNISKEVLLEAIENSLITACSKHFGKADNIRVEINHDTCEYHCYQDKTVVEEVEDPILEISLVQAQMIDSLYGVGDIVPIEVKSKQFGRIAAQNAKNVILQKIREEERKVIFNEYIGLEREVVTGIVQRKIGKNVSINLGKADALLTENEQIRGENLQPTERVKVYIVEVKDNTKGPRILVSRTHPELVKRLFESEVSEVREGIVEIKSISREAGSRSKIAVWSNDPDVDPVGACVGMNGSRVNTIVRELNGEKIDIITWDENPAILIQNSLSPAKVISVIADADEKTAKVVVPDYQLSLAIGKEGQNARLAARLTGFKIDIKSETQARESGDFLDYENEYEDEDYYEEYEEYEEDDYANDSSHRSEGSIADSFEDPEAGADGYGSSGEEADRHGALGEEADGYGSSGEEADGYGSSGEEADGYGALGEEADGYGSSGEEADGYGSSGEEADSYGSSGEEADEYGTSEAGEYDDEDSRAGEYSDEEPQSGKHGGREPDEENSFDEPEDSEADEEEGDEA